MLLPLRRVVSKSALMRICGKKIQYVALFHDLTVFTLFSLLNPLETLFFSSFGLPGAYWGWVGVWVCVGVGGGEG